MTGILDLLNADDVINNTPPNKASGTNNYHNLNQEKSPPLYKQQQQQQQQQTSMITSLTPPSSDSDLSCSLPPTSDSDLSSSLPPSPPKYKNQNQKQQQKSSSNNHNKPLIVLRDQVPKSKINLSILKSRNFVKLAIRRKYSSKKKLSSSATSSYPSKTPLSNLNESRQSKLHIKSLKAGIKIKLTISSNLFDLYLGLIPFTDERKIYPLFKDDESKVIFETLMRKNIDKKGMISKGLQLINNNVADLSEYSNKIIKSFTSESHLIPTFNSLDTAIHSLFQVKNFTLIRITRSTTDDIHGSCILKLETAKPGDFNLIDDEENSDEMLHSLGKAGEIPNNLFFKKIIARPRYKSNMKIYFIPQDLNCSLYTDYRMFERDLFNGIIQIEFKNLMDVNDLETIRLQGYNRNVYCTFPVDDVLRNYKSMLIESKNNPQENIFQQQQQQQQQPLQIPSYSNRSRPVDDVLIKNKHQQEQQNIHNKFIPQLPTVTQQQNINTHQHQQYPIQQQNPYPYPYSYPPPPMIHHSHSFPPPPPSHQSQHLPQFYAHPLQHPQPPIANPISAGPGISTLPSFVHLPPPTMIMQQNTTFTPRSSIIKEDVLNMLRPFNDRRHSNLNNSELVNKNQTRTGKSITE
ncbi:unnamed protein product [Candida verbasci]|uniref:Uncharacterized protein n=1 Tax=Candida verbasci TaxID=1227364 RepID=A0A9W4TU89_9ASCO|nr:unnamed protein product [Candida verbasci]